jgi:hypothetical protein
MEDDSLNIRLKLFLDQTGLSISQFADKCEIARPTFSQLLGGRNKKVSDILLGQIHRAFPELSMVWLMFGEGNMINAEYAPKNDNALSQSSFADGDADAPLLPYQYESGENGDLVRSEDIADDDFANFNSPFGSAQKATSENSSVRMQNPGNIPYNDSANRKYAKENAPIFANSAPQQSDNEADYKLKLAKIMAENNELLRKKPRKVVRITVFYDDNSYESFLPSSNE